MSTATTEGATRNMPSPKELRKECKALDIDGWEDMTAAEMKKAIAKAKKSGSKTKSSKSSKSDKSDSKKSSKKADAKKADKKSSKSKSSDREVAENGNPYPSGSNLFEVTEELLKGGRRDKMVARLKKKIEIKPRDGRDIDEDYEIDRRVLITAQILERDYGFTKEKEGRGTDAKIQVWPPKKSKK